MKILLRLGANQVSLVKNLLYDYLETNKEKIKTNKIIKREYSIARNMYLNLDRRRKRLCSKCGQRIK